jgi:radical SAM superfamily enzyme YgiQ (UPF0313 family)
MEGGHMGKPKLQIIVLFQNLGDQETYFARSPTPPLSGILVAGQTPDIVEVDVHHEMVRPINYDTDADIIALSFMDYCSPHAYDVAARFRKLGKTVVAGGKYASTFPEMVQPHFDTIVVGESERIWPQVVEDLVAGKQKSRYDAPFAPPLDGIPPPRYDLVESKYMTPMVTEATRGCPYTCSFCQLMVKPAPFRKRPIEDVIADLTATEKLPFHRRKLAMLYDNNLGGDVEYAKDLLREVAKVKLWGLATQFSFDCLHDDEYINLLAEAGGITAFIGLESLNEPSLLSVHKKQNRVEEYQELFAKMKERGILTFAGMMLAVEEGRLIDEDLSHYEGDHLVIRPKSVTPKQVFDAFRRVNSTFYSRKNILRRWWRVVTAFRERNPFRWIFRIGVITAVFAELSTFQKDHAEQRVYIIDPEAHE